MDTVYTPGNVPSGPSPEISSFTASPASVAAGRPVTLSWSVTGAEYDIIPPKAGAVRGASIVVAPSATTTYTLYSTNEYGRTTQSVKVTVH